MLKTSNMNSKVILKNFLFLSRFFDFWIFSKCLTKIPNRAITLNGQNKFSREAYHIPIKIRAKGSKFARKARMREN